MIKASSLPVFVSVFFAILIAIATLKPSTANAVPSYARQTGLACNACHTTPPELNSAGRRFKALGYTDRKAETEAVTSESGDRHAPLDLIRSLPLSGWFETSLTATKSAQPGTEKTSVEFPQDVSLFLAGGWSKHVGSFVQVTYDAQDNHFSMDNSDIRYANLGKLGDKEFIYGITLNNNPTVEDLWNTTPAWGFPFIASDSAPTPTAAPIIESLGQDVAGLGGYMLWNDHLYLAGTIYRTDHIGNPQPNSGEGFAVNIRGVAPYGRIAWQQSIGSDNYLEVGGYGMYVKSTPNSVSGLEDHYTDWAADLQFDRTMFVRDVLSVRSTYIRETSSLDATFQQGGASQSHHTLDTFTANAEYHFGNRYSAALGWFDVSGTSDGLLYPPADVAGSANGSPKSAGYITNVSWWPVQNIQIGAQYTWYTRFNGASTNYDGSGRNASGNDTMYVLARFIF
jgi:hypothetical protein